jgi:hypothetical protein
MRCGFRSARGASARPRRIRVADVGNQRLEASGAHQRDRLHGLDSAAVCPAGHTRPLALLAAHVHVTCDGPDECAAAGTAGGPRLRSAGERRDRFQASVSQDGFGHVFRDASSGKRLPAKTLRRTPPVSASHNAQLWRDGVPAAGTPGGPRHRPAGVGLQGFKVDGAHRGNGFGIGEAAGAVPSVARGADGSSDADGRQSQRSFVSAGMPHEPERLGFAGVGLQGLPSRGVSFRAGFRVGHVAPCRHDERLSYDR